MIVILSIRANEASTTDIVQWIQALGGDCVRLNGQDLKDWRWSVIAGKTKKRNIITLLNGRVVQLDDVKLVWFRKMSSFKLPKLKEIDSEYLRKNVISYLKSEGEALRNSLHGALSKATWLSHPDTADPNKLETLMEAFRHGLEIPKTMITNEKIDLINFKKEIGPIIIKPIGNVTTFSEDGLHQSIFTELLTDNMIEKMPDRFFPILVQEAIEKRYELRVFYLDGVLYPMAIFSQNDVQTATDFRIYNYKNPNRTVPYILPDRISIRLIALMKNLNQGTGSIDIMRGINGKYYFLEVNPVGQFGMVSIPCNYHLEKRLAEYLIEKEATC